MRSRSVVLLALALGCGLVASIGISQVMDRRNANEAPVAEMEPILVASADVNYNDMLTPASVRFEEWPKGKVPPGALTKLDELQGRRSAAKLFAGEPILLGKLMGSDGVGAARKIPKGYRVISVQVDAVTGASSLILPDDRVDVLLYMSHRPGSSVEEMSTRTILHDVRVFAVDTQFERQHGSGESAPAAKTVSLLVTLDQAEKVALATGMGQIRLVMRSPDDSEQPDSQGALVSDIIGGVPAAGTGEQPTPGAQFGLPTAPRQPLGVNGGGSGSSSGSGSGSAPAPLPIAETPKMPATWTMVLVEGSEMRDAVLSADKFPVIMSQHVDYAPDPPPPPVAPPADPADASPNPADDAPLEQPTAGDDGFGSITEVPND